MARPSRESRSPTLALRLRFLVAAGQLELVPPGFVRGALRVAASEADHASMVSRLGEACDALLDSRQQLRVPGLIRDTRDSGDTSAAMPALRVTAAECLGQLCEGALQGGRKSTGSYVTPHWVAAAVARACLRGMLEGRGQGPESALSLRMLDPATGAGVFLVAMVDAIADAVGEDESENTVRRIAVQKCFTGYELNPLAAEACRLALWLVASRPGRPAVVPAKAISVRDTLVEPPPRRRYDIVIGNPPWGVTLARQQADELSARWPEAVSGHRDSFLFFLALSADSVRSDGALGLVLPDAVLCQVRYEGMRRLLLRRFRPLSLDRLGTRPFPGATAPACGLCLIGRKVALTSYPVSDRRHAQGTYTVTREETWRIPSHAPLAAPHCSFVSAPGHIEGILSGLRDRHRTLGDLGTVFQFHDSGINYPTAALGRALLYTGPRRHPEDVRVTRGRDFAALTVPGSSAWLRHDWRQRIPSGGRISVRENVYRAMPKLLFRQTGDRPIATIDTKGLYFGRSVIAITAPRHDDLLWLAAVMNSTTFAASYRALAPEAGRPFAQVKVSKLKLVPVPEVGGDHGLAALANSLLAETDEERRSELIGRIDARVAKAYGLDERQRELVRAFVESGRTKRRRRAGTP